MDSRLYPQGKGGVKFKAVGNLLHVYDKNGAIIATFDGDNRTVSVPTGSTVSGAGAVSGVPADDSTLESTTDMHIKDAGVTAAKLATALAGSADGLGLLRCARATFNPTANAGERTVAPHTLGVTIPDKAIIVGGFVDVITTFTDGIADAATIAIHVNAANDIVNAVAIATGTPWDAGRQAIIPKMNTPESTSIRTTAARLVTATVGGVALTQGKAIIYLYYVQSA